MKATVTSEQIKHIGKVLKHWHKPGSAALLGFKAGRLAMRHLSMQRGRSGDLDQAIHFEIEDCIDRMISYDPVGTQILRLRYFQQKTVAEVAHAVGLSIDQTNRRHKQALEKFTELYHQLDDQRGVEERTRQERLLPPCGYSRLFGVNSLLESLREWANQEEPAPVLVLSGMGGVGKTALADALARCALEEGRFIEIAWFRMGFDKYDDEKVAAQISERVFPAEESAMFKPRDELGMAFSRLPYLIVFDEVESREQLEGLLGLLGHWKGPSRFLLTSRLQPLNPGQTKFLRMPEMSRKSGYALIRSYAEEIGVTLPGAEKSEVEKKIFDLVGGNPLALRLMVSLLLVYPLGQVLAGIQSNNQTDVESLYEHIYQAAWLGLTPPTRELLQAMAFVPEGGATLDYLREITAMEEEMLNLAIRQLYERSLLEYRGSLEVKRYGIHRLTKTFLRNMIRDMPSWMESH